MLKKSIFFFSLIFSLCSCEKLSIEENKVRFENCGKPKFRRASWLVTVDFPKENGIKEMRGTLISPRHVLTDSVFLDFPENLKKCSETGYFEAPKRAASALRVGNSTQKYAVRKAFFIGSCALQTGISLFELSVNLETRNPLCLPDKNLHLNPGELIDFYGAGSRQVKSTVLPCYDAHGDALFPDSQSSICMESTIWGSDVGAAFVKKDNGKMVAVAIAGNGTCNPKKAVHPQFDLRNALGQICQLSGACNDGMTGYVPATTENSTSTRRPITRKTTVTPKLTYHSPRRYSNPEATERSEEPRMRNSEKNQEEVEDHVHSGGVGWKFNKFLFLIFPMFF